MSKERDRERGDGVRKRAKKCRETVIDKKKEVYKHDKKLDKQTERR